MPRKSYFYANVYRGFGGVRWPRTGKSSEQPGFQLGGESGMPGGQRPGSGWIAQESLVTSSS